MYFNGRETLILAILTLFLGKYLNQKFRFLQTYNIPEPVTGGVLASILVAIIYSLADIYFEFNLENRDMLLAVFFTSVGLNAKFSMLLRGGKPLLILIACASTFLVLQNLTGIAVATIVGAKPLAGLLGGSISLSGGHGTALAWAPVFVTELGVENAVTIGLAVATFGLVIGGIIGGPISHYLITRYDLKPADPDGQYIVGLPAEAQDDAQHSHQVIDVDSILVTLLTLAVAMGLGLWITEIALDLGLKLPYFVGSLFAGIVLTNTVPALFKSIHWPSGSNSLALISDVSLSLFLAMSLMSLNLLAIFSMAAPLLLLLVAQLVTITVWVIFVIFPLMGKTYDAAVMAGGYAGLGLGATPTAVANMTAITRTYGPSPLAFLIVPLVGAFFIDIANSLILQFFIRLLA